MVMMSRDSMMMMRAGTWKEGWASTSLLELGKASGRAVGRARLLLRQQVLPASHPSLAQEVAL